MPFGSRKLALNGQFLIDGQDDHYASVECTMIDSVMSCQVRTIHGEPLGECSGPYGEVVQFLAWLMTTISGGGGTLP